MDTEWEDGKRKESRGWEGKIKQGWVGGRVESDEGVDRGCRGPAMGGKGLR